MLAQRSPRYICYTCRVCLASQSLSARKCRQLSQVLGQTPTPMSDNVPPVPPASKRPGTPERVPLSELLAKLHKNKSKEVTENSERSAHNESNTATKDSVANRPVAVTKDRIQERESSGGESNSPAPSQGKLPEKTPPKKARPKKKLREPPAPRSPDVPILLRTKRTKLASSAKPTAKKPPSIPKSKRAQSEDGSTTFPIISRRTKQLELPDTPLPNAPQIRLRRKVAKLASRRPNEKVSSKVIRPVQEPQHPGDPENDVPALPGRFSSETLRDLQGNGSKKGKKGRFLRPSPLGRISAQDIQMKPIQPKEHRPIPTLEHGLDRVLFKFPPT